MDRILTTHAGSLIRPQELLDFLAAMEAGEDYDRRHTGRALADAVGGRRPPPGGGRYRRGR